MCESKVILLLHNYPYQVCQVYGNTINAIQSDITIPYGRAGIYMLFKIGFCCELCAILSTLACY